MALLGHQAILNITDAEAPGFTVDAALTVLDIYTIGSESPAFTADIALTVLDGKGVFELVDLDFALAMSVVDDQSAADTPAFVADLVMSIVDSLGDTESPAFALAASLTQADELHAVEVPGFDVVIAMTMLDQLHAIETPAFTPVFDLTATDTIPTPGEAVPFTADFTMTVLDTETGEGVRFSPDVLLTGADFTSTLIMWSVSVPAGAAFVVEVSYDGGFVWHACTSGSALPSLPGSPDGVTLKTRQTFTSNGDGDYPILSYLRVEVGEPLLLESGQVVYNYTPPRAGDQGSRSSVRRTGNVVLTEPVPSYLDPGVSLLKPYIEMQAPSTDNWVRFDLGEFRTLAPQRADRGERVSSTFRIASREQLYAKAKTTDWVVAGLNRNIVLFVREDILVPIFGETSFDFPATTDVIPADIAFPPNTSWLEVMNKALESAGWDALTVNSSGQNSSRPAVSVKASEWDYPTDTPVIKAAEIEPFSGDIPNVLIFTPRRGPSLPVEGNGIFTVKNFNTGPYSINSRGGLEVTEEISLEAIDQEALARLGLAIAETKFRGGGDRLRMSVGMNPLHDDQDAVTVTQADLGLSSERFWVTNWQVNLGVVTDMSTMSLSLEKMVTGIDSADDPVAVISDAGVATETATATTALSGDEEIDPMTDTALAVSAAHAIVDGGAPA